MNEYYFGIQCDHQNIVKTYEYYKTKKKFYIVQEFIHGKNLKEMKEI